MNTQPNNRGSGRVQPGSKVLMTGGTGFLGAYIIRELVNNGYKVMAIRRSPTIPTFIDPEIWRSVEWVDGDVLDPVGLASAISSSEAVIHSAAVVSFHHSDREQLYRVNVEGTANVVNAAIEHPVKRFIHISSVAALGRKNDGSLVAETRKWEESRSNTHYAISKYQGEMEVWRGIAEGLSAVIVNPSTILGYGDWGSSSCAIFKNVHDGFAWYSNGTNGFVDVEDVAKLIVLLLSADVHSERFIINAENRSYKSVLDAIADAFGTKRPHREATPFLSSLAWRIEKLSSLFTGRKPLLNKETARIARSDTRFDNSKIREAFPGFAFTQLDETIKNACSRYSSGHS